MSKELVISASSHERRVAILEEGQLVEIYIEREKEFALVGSIYKGKVTRVLPGMQSAFVDIGLDGDAFLYVSDVFENLEDYDHGHEHVATPAVARSGEGSGEGAGSIDILPGEHLARASAGSHEEILSLDEPHAEHAGTPGEDGPVAEGEPQSSSLRAADGPAGGDEQPHTYDERQPDSNASAPPNYTPQYNPT